MSEKIPISLHNSDLFLNPEVTDINKEEKYIESTTYSISKKGPSLGENNYYRSLHALYLLCKSEGMRAKASSLLQKPSFSKNKAFACKTEAFTSNVSNARLFAPRTQHSSTLNKAFLQNNSMPGSDFIDESKESFSQQITSLPQSYPIQANVESVHPLTLEDVHVLPLPLLSQSSHSSKNNLYSLHYKSFLDKVNRRISLGISREFLFVAINLLLLSILTIVQRSHYGKSFSTRDQKSLYTILFENKLPNLSISYGLPKHLNGESQVAIHSGKKNNEQKNNRSFLTSLPHKKKEKVLGVFLGKLHPTFSLNHRKEVKPNTSSVLSTGRKVTFVMHKQAFCNACKSEAFTSKTYGFAKPLKATQAMQDFVFVTQAQKTDNTFLLSKKASKKYLCKCKSELGSHFQQDQTLTANSTQNVTLFKDYTIKPWYCIKASNTCNTHMVATRSTKQASKNDTLYQKLTIKRSEYYIPFCTTQRRIFAESDTIPEKRSTIYSKTAQKIRMFAQLDVTPGAVTLDLPKKRREDQVYSSRNVSDLVLKEFFYKYGFFCSYDLSTAQKVIQKESHTKASFLQACVQNQSFCKNEALFVHGQYFSIFDKIKNLIRSFTEPQENKVLHLFHTNKGISPLGLTQSKYNLERAKFAAFIQERHAVPPFHFIPDTILQNTSVSGYQFPELQRKEITYLFRKIAIFHFYVYTNTVGNPNPFEKGVMQENIPFVSPYSGFLPFSKCKHNRVFVKASTEQSDANSSLKPRENVAFNSQKERVVDRQMQYTQVSLDEMDSVKELFNKMGRDYENYIRQPKDSLPALIISPSLEDDREIEEEGIRIFRKRDLIKRRDPKDIANSNSDEFLSTEKLSLLENQNSEIQDHQSLVKNALRQAQEEIDDIAKKEEKGSLAPSVQQKEKQVIPPLTRLEALYTIRQREKRYEQAKKLKVGKHVNKGKLTFTKRSSPYFEELFLYSDKINNNHLKSSHFVDIPTPWLFSNLGDEKSNKAQPKWRFALVRTDRKHAFFGEMSLLAHKLTAQEQKKVFQQKANLLLKLNRDNTELYKKDSNANLSTLPFSLLSPLFVSSKNHNKVKEAPRFKVGQLQTKVVSPVTLPYSQGGKEGLPEREKLKKVDGGYVTTKLDWIRGPSRVYFYDTLSQNKGCQVSIPKVKGTPLESPVSHRVWQPKRMEPSTFRVLPRSQSTPVVPQISQKDWKQIMEWQLQKYFFESDKRLGALSAFVGAENVRLSLTRELDYKQGKQNNIPLPENTIKRFKIKKINLYLPWICIKKGPNTDSYLNKADLDLLFVDKRSNSFVNPLRLPESNAVTTPFDHGSLPRSFKLSSPFQRQDCLTYTDLFNHNTKYNRQSTPYWRCTTQQSLLSTKAPRKEGQKSGFKKSKVETPNVQAGVVQKAFRESVLFESVTKYSWLFIYTFVFVLMFKQLFQWIYKVGLREFFVNFCNSDFGRTITSEEFRYSIQNVALKEYYMPNKRLQDLFSLEKNKVELLEIVWFLRNRCQGRHGPRGVLLVGPPGVESVSVVQAIAGEAGLPIIVQSLEKIAQDNEPQRQLEQLYTRAHKQAPCVLFLDQLDTIGARRDQLFTDKTRLHNLTYKAKGDSISLDQYLGGDTPFVTEKENVATSRNKLNVVLRLLTILDGITQSSGVVTVATARDLTKLDPALLRPKRFDRRIYLSLPNRQDRVHLFKIQTQNIGHSKEMPWDYLSLQTENMSVADIQSAVNYSLFRAILKRSVHTLETLEYGIDCVKTLTEKRIQST